MEKTVYTKTKTRRIHLIISSILGVLFILSLVLYYTSEPRKGANLMIFMGVMTLSQLVQYFLKPNWILKYDEDKIIINQHLFTKKIEAKTGSFETKKLITGDIEINYNDKSYEIPKDIIEEEEYHALLKHLQLS